MKDFDGVTRYKNLGLKIPPPPINPQMGGDQVPHFSQSQSQFLVKIRVFTPETAHSEARFGILVKNQPGGWILSQIGAIWTHFVANYCAHDGVMGTIIDYRGCVMGTIIDYRGVIEIMGG